MSRKRHTYELAQEVGVDRTIISRIFITFTNYLCEHHSHRLYNNLNFFRGRFPLYNSKLKAKIVMENQYIPASVESTALFTDGTRLEICRPMGPYHIQREYYHGKDKIHCLAFQATTAMDGMIVDLFGGYPGSRHDSYICNRSLLNQRIRQSQLGNQIQYKTYMDKGYVSDTHSVAAYHIYPHSPEEHRNANRIMSPQRIGVEWGINKLGVVCPFIHDIQMMKVQLSSISSYVFVAALFCNLHSCLYGSQSGLYFNCMPPRLDEYLN